MKFVLQERDSALMLQPGEKPVDLQRKLNRVFQRATIEPLTLMPLEGKWNGLSVFDGEWLISHP